MSPEIPELEVDIIPQISEIQQAHQQNNSSFHHPLLASTIPFFFAGTRKIIEELDHCAVLSLVGVIFVSTLYFLHVIALCYGNYRLYRPVSSDVALPGVSIIKPIIGADDNLYENLETFFTTQYHKYELLFCFNTSDDPAVKTVESLMKKYPMVDAALFFGGERVGLNPKINNMMPAYRTAKFPLIMISDSAIYIKSDAILDMATTLMKDERLGLITQIPYCKDRIGFAPTFEQIYFGTSHARIYLAGNCMQFVCATGMSSMMKKHALDECGGFAAFGGYLAEDYFFGKKLASLGYKSGISAYPALQNAASITMTSFTNRACRWIKLRAAMMPHIILVEPFQDCFPSGLIISFSLNYLIGVDVISTMILHVVFWISMDYVLMSKMQKKTMRFSLDRFIVMWLLRELSALPVIIKAVMEPSIHWRNNVFNLAWGGKIRSSRQACEGGTKSNSLETETGNKFKIE